MKIVICTTPIRPEPTTYPPFACVALMQSLRSAGYSPYFYDIDALRPEFQETVDFIREQSPDVLGISAVVSTAYEYTKKLALAVKTVSPNTKIVVGGNLSASAEILLRFCNVDVCGIGEGENVIVDLARYWESHPDDNDYTELRQVKGISYLDESDEVIFTGYDIPIPASDFTNPDFSILEKYSKIEHFITDPLSRYDLCQDPRTHEAKRQGKKLGMVITAKGCVARCTFCHRWDRGYRHWTVDKIIENVQYLVDRYNVGFINFGDENFGSDRKKLDELIERIKPLDILWLVGGVRVPSVDPDLLRRMRDAGCVSVSYGMETGSPRILKIMEKNTTIQQNIDAARWTYEAGLYTIYQIVLGMPGEDHQTVAETGQFINDVTEFLHEPPHKRLSINYIQALPGTPVYEYARDVGLIGRTIEDEEQYLLDISDTNAVDDTKFLNFSQYDYFTVQAWRPRLVFNAEANWFRKHGWKTPANVYKETMGDVVIPEVGIEEDFQRGGYFNLGHIMIRQPWFYRFISNPIAYPLRALYSAVYVLSHDIRVLSKRQILAYCWQFLQYKVKRPTPLKDYRSLRPVMKDRAPSPETQSEESMQPLRLGR